MEELLQDKVSTAILLKTAVRMLKAKGLVFP